jgi:hypothetical protein
MGSVLLFSERRDIPFAFASRSPSMWALNAFLRWFKPLLPVERGRGLWYTQSVGIWLLHRDLWHECGGFDERMIYMNAMEQNMIDRLKPKYELVDLGKLVGHAFYHLNHHPPREGRKAIRYRRVNPKSLLENTESMNPNGDGWGLAKLELPILPAREVAADLPFAESSTDQLRGFARLVLVTGATSAWYGLTKPMDPHRWHSDHGVVFKRRVETARDTIAGQPLTRWPSLLRMRWNERLSKPSNDR